MSEREDAAVEIVLALAKQPAPIYEGPTGSIHCSLCNGDEWGNADDTGVEHEETCAWLLSQRWFLEHAIEEDLLKMKGTQ